MLPPPPSSSSHILILLFSIFFSPQPCFKTSFLSLTVSSQVTWPVYPSAKTQTPNIKSRIHVWEKRDILLFWGSKIFILRQFPVPAIFGQMSHFHFSLWRMSPCVSDFHCPFVSAQTFPWFHFPAVVNSVAISMAVQVMLWADIETSGSHKGIAGLYGSSAFGFWGVVCVCVCVFYTGVDTGNFIVARNNTHIPTSKGWRLLFPHIFPRVYHLSSSGQPFLLMCGVLVQQES